MKFKPFWYSGARINRSKYWLLSWGGFVILGGLFVLASTVVTDYDARVFIAAILAVIYLCLQFILFRFRVNDLSPETWEGLSRKGLIGILGTWMMEFTPSRREHSFEESPRTRRKEIEENPKTLLLNVMVFLLVYLILIALGIFLVYRL